MRVGAGYCERPLCARRKGRRTHLGQHRRTGGQELIERARMMKIAIWPRVTGSFGQYVVAVHPDVIASRFMR
jgi:hypothetical protein